MVCVELLGDVDVCCFDGVVYCCGGVGFVVGVCWFGWFGEVFLVGWFVCCGFVVGGGGGVWLVVGVGVCGMSW